MNIYDFCEKYDMLPIGSHVLVAVSGGKDSMCLLELLLSTERFGLKISCAHFDHSLRGEDSSRDRVFVEEYCSGRGIPCYTGSGDVSAYAAENALGLEEAARVLRYEFLEKTAEDIRADRIATAHTADDNVETLLLNLARGSGLKGLCGIPPIRGKIIRPLLTKSTADVLSYLNENHIPYVEDKTNAEDFYARNRVRHAIIPLLRNENMRFDENAARCISLLREDDEYLEGLAQDFLSEFYDGRSLPAAAFAKLGSPVSARVLKTIVSRDISFAHIQAVRSIASRDNPHAAADIPGMRVYREYERLIFGCHGSDTVLSRSIVPGDCLELSSAGLRISCGFVPNYSKVHNSVNNFYFKNESICDRIVLRSRLEGDKIRLSGRNCTKTLKKLFNEAKLNGETRDLVPVFSDGEGVIAVYGFGIAERCTPRPGDDVIRIQIEKIIPEKDI